MVLDSRLRRSPRRPALFLLAVIAVVAAGCTATSTSTANHPVAGSSSTSTAPQPTVTSTPTQAPHTGMRVAWNPEREPFVSPVQPENRPNAVAGDTNGRMPARDLVGVAPNCLAARAAGPSLGLLLATARDEGVVLGTEQCYRPLSGQVTVRQKWSAAGNSSCAAPVLTTASGAPVGTSIHGWGMAADLSGVGGTLTFGSPAYQFLTAHAGRFGWNHPAWAQPGGSTCPEAWHWEWVGDGGRQLASPIRADVLTLLPTWDGLGYSIVTGLGAVRPYGDANDDGPLRPLAWLVVAAARAPVSGGYWLVDANGSVHAFGGAPDLGSLGAHPPARPIVGMAPSASGAGYWLAASNGQVFPFGDAAFYGSPVASGRSLTRPIVAIAATPDGQGYWLAGADGKVFAYGDATFYGKASTGSLGAPIVSMASTPDGRGYWLAGADGKVFAFGDAGHFGSTGRIVLPEPVIAIAPTPDGGGYWLVAADG